MFFLPEATEESPPMFESEFVDAFSRTAYWVVPLIYVPAIALLLSYSAQLGVSWPAMGGLAFAGFVWWTLMEYWLHRTLFHWEPPGKLGERFHFILHGVHHQWPDDRLRLVFPVALSMTLFWIFCGLSVALLGTFGWAFHAGLVVGYITYDLTHYYLHHGRAKQGRMRRLRQHHVIHHFKKGHEGKFGVSTTIWDRVFGTMEMKRVGPGEQEA